MIDLRGLPGDCGLEHGRMLSDQLASRFLDPFVASFSAVKRCPRDAMAAQARVWRDRLPEHFQEEMDGMARGGGVPQESVDLYLFADIAAPAEPIAPAEHDPDRISTADEPAASDPAPVDGPMCSGIATELDRRPWVGRNCDWYRRLLRRGTAAVVHRVPGRIPVMALGIHGDIDCDTGVNAERLWMHIHTLHATDTPAPGRSNISWLFWCREALETCATIDELERFIEGTARDRGVIVFAADGKTGHRAIFECGRATHERFDAASAGDTLFACNHRRDKHPTDPGRLSRSRPASTTRRYERLRSMLSSSATEPLHPEHGPDDLIDVLADEEVEMRTPPELRTIYSAICEPATGGVWFSSGAEDGTPAASRGSWERVPWPF